MDAALSPAAPGHGTAWRQEEGTGKEGVAKTEGEQEGNGQQQPRGPTVPAGVKPTPRCGRGAGRSRGEEQSSELISCSRDGGRGGTGERRAPASAPWIPWAVGSKRGSSALTTPQRTDRDPRGGGGGKQSNLQVPPHSLGGEYGWMPLPPTHPGGTLSTQNCWHRTDPDAPSLGVTQQGQCQPAAPPPPLYTPRNSPASAPTQLPPAPRCPQLIRAGREGGRRL